jgi:hypothetical protein
VRTQGLAALARFACGNDRTDVGFMRPPYGRGVSIKRRSLLAAVRERMRHQAAVRESEDGASAVRSEPVLSAPPRRVKPDLELEQRAAEARYHRDRFDLYRARVISGSSAPTSSARLRELERTATAAEARLAHAHRSASIRPAGE